MTNLQFNLAMNLAMAIIVYGLILLGTGMIIGISVDLIYSWYKKYVQSQTQR